MNSITKEQIDKLSPEQQEVIGSFEAQRICRQFALLEKAGLYRGFYSFPTLAALSAAAVAVFGSSAAQLLAFCIIGLGCLIQFHAIGLNQRIDALIEILNWEIKKAVNG